MSNLQTWSDVLITSLQDTWAGVVGFVPTLLAAIVLFLVGWFIAVILGRVVSQLIKAAKLDTALRGAGFDKVVEKGGFTLNSGVFIGELVKWFIIVVVLVASLDILGLDAVTMYLRGDVLPYLPRVIIASLILLISIVIAQAIQKLVVSSAKAANISHANVLGEIAKWVIWLFALTTVLQQLNLDILNQFIGPIFIGIIAALALALGLSFGLGGKEAAARYIEKIKSDISSR